MKLINSIGPNPKVVRMYMAERGISLETLDIDLVAGENRQPDYLSKNPSGTTPALQLDDGSFVAEITVICEYLDDKNGNSDLIGTTAEARAETRMWGRRIDLQIMENVANGFRYSEGLAMFKDRLRTIPHAADDLKILAQERLTWLDQQMAGKQFVCGDRFTLADIMLYCFLEFGVQVGQPLNAANKNISAWYERVAARPSAAA
ncbi:glutathione S-transferase family protein [Pseudomonadales bacterium]|nr:glutathione S-transferase family protein [Pseudomonadales bacterium]MDB9868101.1 glutathione S-transferase family protein [Pseudomonadales bacterium]MDB9880307.1 glutathione S-transferase family protein [Pseudomonadales bacterium]MDB9917630.1 glutathione S-transferase family protein [Pseudomonadales bacterium]MDB9942729.1 glutathione S-transferase family protein [Pseudomonadales bacterium]|tara:strand:+ start:501 stop:1112 length:612 start_codon:yes stop_codon:yes gene_type:complete